MNNTTWKVVLDHACQLGEGPVWDADQQRILWVDILPGEIHSFYPASGEHRIFKTGQMTGAIALLPSGNFIAALQHGFHEISLENETVVPIADPEVHLPENRFNDGKCDPAGRFWAGTMSISDEPGAGALYMLDNDQSVSIKVENVTCSNGLAWSLDHQLLYYIDSPTRQVVAYDYAITTGTIANKRVVIQFEEEDGFPDGMTIDEKGMLWIALWDGWKVIRCNPNTGERLQQIDLPAARITSCTFGGESLEDLYITSAKTGLSQQESQEQPLAGCLFVVRNTGIKGVRTHGL
ncbi:SMP-30/gluconolactonase/LRE family protein [Larkinella rosea]|uniref:Regucalcin n=1 Tax=Larkinella rosea TaxID=2025312 RepID=A0A3P1BCS4_9BACT|nr:SMP-30/gluconolactonase/LRE family protein [Larkinella rosea]RRA98900.1 SMP-30/gluconolactonase/LRE family protein [Larkinella rosea]